MTGSGRSAARVASVVAAVSIAALLAAAWLFGHYVRAFWLTVPDDTYITLRYAANLAAGIGPTWNPEGPRAEGYVLAQHPDLVILPSFSRSVFLPPHPWHFRLVEACREAGMERIRVIGATYRLFLYARPGGRIARSLQRWNPARDDP